MTKINLDNLGLGLIGVAVVYAIYQAVQYKKAVNLLGGDGNQQYAAVWSDNYDWRQELLTAKERPRLIYA